MFLSLSARILANVEALNMIESIGNMVRHRKAPVVIKQESNEYKIVFVPAISGESLAHGYQATLAKLASEVGVPVCERCSREEFIKHSTDELFTNKDKELFNEKLDPHEFEKRIIKHCTVEDIGGFLYTGGDYCSDPVKRTSKIQFSYMIPTYDTIKNVAVESQFHVRYAPSEPREPAQAIYYVDTGSALYGVMANLELSGILKTSMVKIENVIKEEEKFKEEFKKRVDIAIKALYLTLASPLFGGHRSRFNPHWEIESLVVALAKPLVFTVSPPHSKIYISSTVVKAKDYKELFSDTKLSDELELKIYYYISDKSAFKEEELPKDEEVEGLSIKRITGSVEELFNEVWSTVKNWIEST